MILGCTPLVAVKRTTPFDPDVVFSEIVLQVLMVSCTVMVERPDLTVKIIFALFLIFMLITAALPAHKQPMNLQGRRLGDTSMGLKASACGSDATVSSTAANSSKTLDRWVATSNLTPTTPTTTNNVDAKSRDQTLGQQWLFQS
ncbi:hypothetical protein NL676_020623 [Syzygium grande]|nr:hypothetical protein NL676_020623 [Syzygium grande]